jgi:outer membrane protein insertion porin family
MNHQQHLFWLWCAEVSKNRKKMRLSTVLVALVAASTTLISNSAKGETTQELVSSLSDRPISDVRLPILDDESSQVSKLSPRENYQKIVPSKNNNNKYSDPIITNPKSEISNLQNFPAKEKKSQNLLSSTSIENGKSKIQKVCYSLFLCASSQIGQHAQYIIAQSESSDPSTEPTTPSEPATPSTEPTTPSESGEPQVEPTTPSEPATPSTEPTTPSESGEPQVEPTVPSEPSAPSTEPSAPSEPVTPPTEPTVPSESGTPSTEPSAPSEPATPSTEPTVPSEPGTPSTEPSAPSEPGTPSTEPGTNQPETEAPEPRVLVAEVVVSGAEAELQDLVYREIRTQPGRTTTRSQLQEDVNAVYATGFFGNVTVTPEDTPLGVRITFVVTPNPILDRVEIKTVPETAEKRVLPEEVVNNIFTPRYGKILNLRELQEDIKKLNDWYKENGYDLAQVVGAPAVSQDGVVTLIVAEGIIEDIQVRFFDKEGETAKGKTRDFIILREIQLKSGDVFNRQTARNDLQRVFGLGIFEDAKFSFSPGEDPSKVIVNVDVVEGNTGSIAAGAGISSASGFFGTLSYQQKNIGGNNQTLGAEVELGTRDFDLSFDLRFTDPWIGGDPFRTSYTVNAFRRRSISLIFDGGEEEITLPHDEDEDDGDRPRVVRTGGGVSFSRPLAPDPFTKAEWRLSTGFQYQHVEIEDSDGDISPRDELGNRLSFSDSGIDDLFTLQFGATRDLRNSVQQPTSGSLLRLGADQWLPLGSGSILGTRLRGSYSYFIPVSLINFSEGPQAIALNVQAGTVIGDLPPYEAFSIGGSNSVRGYDEGEVGSGRSYLQANIEYRFPLFSVVGGALFFDYGTDLGSGDAVPGNPAGVRDKPGSGFGYGVGVRVQSPIGPIRVDYGFNDQGDSRIHFGIGERF